MKSKEQEFFERSHPAFWYQVSDELFESLILLHSKNIAYIEYEKHFYPIISKAYFLLAGYCLENIIKSLLIVENPELIDNGKLNKKLLNHDLKDLFAMSKKIRANKYEIELLKILSEATPYWGRYPIPRRFDQLLPEIYLDDNIHRCFVKLFSRSRKKLYMLTKDGYIGKEAKKIPGWKTVVVKQ